MIKVITAQEARDIATSKMEENFSELMQSFFNRVDYASDNGDLSTTFYTGGVHFSETELKYIRDLGYSITWNSPCLWYEISWEK